MASEMADLVRRQGGTPLSAPAMQEVPLTERRGVLTVVDRVCRDEFKITIFLTGVGLRAFLAAADAAGKKPEVLAALGRAQVVCRGPKPLAVCRQNNIPVFLVAPEPNTSEDLLAALKDAAGDMQGARILLQHYGVANMALKAALEGLGAQVTDVHLYEWALPKDVEPVRAAIDAMIAGGTDAILLTSQQQVRNLFTLARQFGTLAPLKKALADRVIVGSVGPVVTRTLVEEGIRPRVVPDHPKMGALVVALATYMDRLRTQHTA
ncbi:MAG: uroporphyrinogen-III synthase [Dehalococcoidia bacterium]|nr:uroporphyrinogen-III synthase [Dehalococcoidia bacterium]